MNVARHLTNIPGGELNPQTYSDAVVDLFDGLPNTDVEVWKGERLREERMNLLLAVGGAAEHGPRLVHVSYRPKSAPANTAPIAIVGKGITFDSGGLDIKPSSGMRWMKKDMGGSAASVGLAYWAVTTGLPLPLDIYLSIAENAIGAASFRPGDVITARSGTTVEIGNTDAEGRLVLADALDVAVNAEEKPQALINIATLTGAIKVGLGGDIAGLFANNDSLATEIEEAGRRTGDLSWRMPLFQPYKSMLRSTFADTHNCSDGGFGGAITAALFLEMFVKDVPWAHLDIYAWKDGAGGPFAESGGNGQPIQALSSVLSRMAEGARSERA
jgi:leucyl aminopeptidase